MANETVTIPGLPAADKAYGDMILPAARGAGDYGVSVEQLREYINAPGWHGTQAQYNALASYDAERWYFIELDDEVVAIYRGDQLVHAVPNLVGEFFEDTTADDWYWFPNRIKTPLPVDPVTKRFSTYFSDDITFANNLFGTSTFKCRLKKIERIPILSSACKDVYLMLGRTDLCEMLPVVDMRYAGGRFYNELCYVLLTNTGTKQLHFANTSRIIRWQMTVNINQLLAVTGVDFSSTVKVEDRPFHNAAYLSIVNLGKAPNANTFDLSSPNWGDDSKFPGSRQSLVDTLLTNSFNRASAGYTPLTIKLHSLVIARLTSSEISQINAKGYTLVTT